MPPALIAGAIAIGASAAAAASIITVTTAMVIATAATLAGALLTKADVPSLTGYTEQPERKQVLRSSSAPKVIIYGETLVSGLLFFAEEQEGEQDEDEWLHMAIAVCAHKVEAITAVWLGDDRIETYGTLAQYQVHNDETLPPQDMLGRCPSWKTDMIGKGMCWVRISLKFDQEKYPAGVPNVKFTVKGKQCYDPRTGLTQWTNNAALCIMDYYRSVLGLQTEDLIYDDFIEGANICDEQINGSAYTEKRYRLNGSFDVSEAISSTLDDLHMACAGEATYIGGRHGLLVGAYYGPATMVLDESQVIGSVKIIPETSWSEKVNTVTGTFVDPEQNYSKVDFPSVQVAPYVLEDGNEFVDDVNYRFVTSEYQAQRLAQININRKRLGRTIELTLNFKAYMYRPGFYVKVTLRPLGIINQEFRVTKWSLEPSGKGISVTLRQETSAVWGDAIGQPIDRPDLTNLPGVSVSAPTNVQFVPVAADAILNYQGVLSWVNPGAVDFTQVIIQGNGKTVVSLNSKANSIQVNGLDKGVTYTAYLRNSGKGGILSNIASLQFQLAIDSKYLGDIYANNGYFAGTVYANRIEGDLYNRQSGGLSKVNPDVAFTVNRPAPEEFSWSNKQGDHVLWAIAGEDFDRVLDTNMSLTLESAQRQYLKVYVRTPGRPDTLIGEFDTGNNGENGLGIVPLQGISLPMCGRGNFNYIIVNIGENRPAGCALWTPWDVWFKKMNDGMSGTGDVINVAVRQAPWVAVYRKGRIIATSAEV